MRVESMLREIGTRVVRFVHNITLENTKYPKHYFGVSMDAASVGESGWTSLELTLEFKLKTKNWSW